MQSPCFECELKKSDKNNLVCAKCRERINYALYLEYPNKLSAIPPQKCKTKGCKNPNRVNDLCLRCAIINWKLTHPKERIWIKRGIYNVFR